MEDGRREDEAGRETAGTPDERREEKTEETGGEGYSEYRDGDLTVCDILCDACVYRFAGDMARCRKYPQGKPEEILDPDYFCGEFAMNDGILE